VQHRDPAAGFGPVGGPFGLAGQHPLRASQAALPEDWRCGSHAAAIKLVTQYQQFLDKNLQKKYSIICSQHIKRVWELKKAISNTYCNKEYDILQFIYITSENVRPLSFLISNFRRVLNVVCFLLGDSPASEFYIPTFRNTLFHLHRQVGACTRTYLPMKMGQCSETSAYKIQTPGNHPKESTQRR
jgi:hypothetical protein